MVLGNVRKNGEKIGQIFYDGETLYLKGTPEKRMNYLGGILKDQIKLNDFLKRFHLEERLELSNKYLEHNAGIVRRVYGHNVVAKDLAKLYQLPNWEKIKAAV